MRPSFFLACALCTGAVHAAPPDVDAVNHATGAVLGPSSRGAAVLRAQILLDRVHFGSGEIDGVYGANLRAAIDGFARAHNLPAAGRVTPAMWDLLGTDTPALTTYTTTAADVAGPFAPVPADMKGKSRLPALGYASALEGLAEKFHASPALLKDLNPEADFASAGVTLTVPNVRATEPLPQAGRILVDQSDHTLTVYDTAGKPIAQFPATTGSAHDPLPIGTWKIKLVSSNPVFFYNPDLFWDASAADRKTRIAPGPNNPVGVAWLELTKPHYGIHGTPEPSAIGKTQSHGCIRLTNWDVTALVKSVPTGTEVVLQE